LFGDCDLFDWNFLRGARDGSQLKIVRRLFTKNTGLCKLQKRRYRGWSLPSAGRL